MAGIYIHIPFCRQACHYCNFHFSTSLLYKNELIEALLKEIEIRKDYLENVPVETIYFGGGTPSLLEFSDIQKLIDKIYEKYKPSQAIEFTFETNPDDISEAKLLEWKKTGINRLSIGVQSFFEEDLRWMNRAHNAEQAFHSITSAKKYFENITIDLIYGTPLTTNEKWKQNLEKFIALEVPHLSCYALTVEPKTPLDKMIRLKEKTAVDPGMQSEQFLFTMDWLKKAGYEHYEISSFAKPGYRSRHNSSYWSGEKYIGLGPSAHSYNGVSRQWNISNNNIYIRSLKDDILSFEEENLTPVQKLNEYIMTSLRTMEGASLKKFNSSEQKKIRQQSEKYLRSGMMEIKNDFLILTNQGKLMADGIAADLFF